MEDKEFHIISSGVSIITNLKSKEGLYTDIKISDENRWKQIVNNPVEISRVVEIVKSKPMEMSAELNTFLRVVDGKNPSNISVYLFGTNTASNELCRIAIQEYLKEKGYVLYSALDVSGYFHEAKYDPSFAKDEFQEGLSRLIDILIYIALKKKEEGYTVFFNPTGGLKAHVIATAMAGFITGSQVYYMNEEFNDVVFLPNLFYLPRGKELILLNILAQRGEVSIDDLITSELDDKVSQEYRDGIQRLSLYGLVEVKNDRVILTQRGLMVSSSLGGK
ncbi:MAG: putative CRISPR-associated protein [Spirochaetia bacterium]|nr:putative CRISPR-associated protein [Spirochaetota bacterium]MDW8113260.1 putative CRISPR-associated protein [Spirochaetia bacterium]